MITPSHKQFNSYTVTINKLHFYIHSIVRSPFQSLFFSHTPCILLLLLSHHPSQNRSHFLFLFLHIPSHQPTFKINPSIPSPNKTNNITLHFHRTFFITKTIQSTHTYLSLPIPFLFSFHFTFLFFVTFL